MDNLLPSRLLILVAKTGTFSGAGRILGLSPGSVFRYMNQLEDEVGATLFHRSNRKVALTPMGEAFLARVSKIIHDVDQLTSDIKESTASGGGKLHMHVPTALGRKLIVPLLPEFLEKFPDLRLRLMMSDEEVDLVESNLDLSITTETPTASALISRKLVSCSRKICASPGYVESLGNPNSPEDVVNHDCISFEFDLGEPCWRFREGSVTKAIRPNSVIRANDEGTMLSLALAGVGLVMLPEWFVASDLEAGRLVPVLKNYECSPRLQGGFQANVLAVYRKSRHPSSNLKLFLQFLAASLRQKARSNWRSD